MSLLSPSLEAFVAVATHKTVHGAAEVIHLTQTAVTQRIRSLEKKLHATLFKRTRRGMVLTKEGEALLRYCHASQELARDTLTQIQGAAIESEIQLCISGPTSIMHARVIPECLPVLQCFPQLLLHFDINDSDQRAQALRAGKCDFAIVEPEQVALEMASKSLKPEQYVLVCSSRWRERKLRDIIRAERIIDFEPSDRMTYHYLQHYHLFEEAQHGRHFVNRTEILAAMVIEGLGYTTLIKEFAMPYVAQGQLMMLNNGKAYNHTPVLAWYARHEAPEYFVAIIEAIK